MVRNTKKQFNARSKHAAAMVSDSSPAPQLDVSKYVVELTDDEITEAQASELLSVLIPVIWHFVDLGFRVDISELLLSWADSDALDSSETSKMETPSKAESEVAAQ